MPVCLYFAFFFPSLCISHLNIYIFFSDSILFLRKKTLYQTLLCGRTRKKEEEKKKQKQDSEEEKKRKKVEEKN